MGKIAFGYGCTSIAAGFTLFKPALEGRRPGIIWT